MRLRLFLSLVSVTAMVAVGATPVVAHADVTATGSTSVACATPPSTDGATPENRDRFVSLWSARFADIAWREHYISLATVPADILAEGFHSLPKPTQLWLSACLLDSLLATAHVTPTPQQREMYLTGVALVIFGKPGTDALRDQLNAPAAPPVDAPPTDQSQTGQALDAMAQRLASAPSLTSGQQPTVAVDAPQTHASATLTATPPARQRATLTSTPLAQVILGALSSLLQQVSKVQNTLFTLPVVNLLAPAFYKICAESPTMPLACSVSLPVGVPVPADVTGDGFPDVFGQLSPQISGLDIGARFFLQRMAPNSGPLPAHVFAVYDTPIVKKRIEVGFDGRTSTLSNNSSAVFYIKNAAAALAGDVQVGAKLAYTNPASSGALTFAVKTLTGGSSGVPATEDDPVTGSVQLSPLPTTLDVGAHLTHSGSHSQDTITVNTPAPTRVDAIVDQATTSGQVDSTRRFTATVDKLPSDVTVNLTNDPKHQNIDYSASSPIDYVEATDTSTDDVTQPSKVDHTVVQVDGVPSHVNVDLNGGKVVYAANASIPKVYAGVDRANGDKMTAQVNDIPAQATVTFDGKGSTLDWNASAATTSATANAHLTPDTTGLDRPFDAGLTITSIPARWNASWANGNVVFDAPAAPVGSIEANVTNHDTFSTLPGDHLTAYYDKASGNLDASLRISKLQHASYTRLADTGSGGGFVADLDMGDHGAFGLGAEAHTPDGDVIASGGFTNLPAQITLRSQGGHLTYSGDSHPDLTLSVAAGRQAAIAATPLPPMVHGVAVRDGSDGTNTAVRANVYLTGLPTGLDLNTATGVYTMTGYHPTNGTLVVDAVLNHLADKPISLQLQQVVPTGSDTDLTFGPFTTTTAANGDHSLGVSYVASQALGSLTADATYDNTDAAHLFISQIPATITVGATFGTDTKRVHVQMSQGIDKIVAAYKHVGQSQFAASAELDQVPATVDLDIGKGSSSGNGTDVTAPVFTMTASDPGMDIHAFAAANIKDPSINDLTAAVKLDVTDLGKVVTADLAGSHLHITSTPATGGFSLDAAGHVSKDIPLDWDGGIFQNRGHVNADLTIHRVTLGLTDFSDVTLRLGFTTGLDGSYGSFTFGQDSNLVVTLSDHFYVYIDWPDPLGSSTLDLMTIPEFTKDFGNVVPDWHINQDVYGKIFHLPVLDFGIADCGVTFNARPAPGETTPGNTFTLLGGGPRYLITPDINIGGLSLPAFALDVIAYFLNPYDDSDITADPECQWDVSL